MTMSWTKLLFCWQEGIIIILTTGAIQQSGVVVNPPDGCSVPGRVAVFLSLFTLVVRDSIRKYFLLYVFYGGTRGTGEVCTVNYEEWLCTNVLCGDIQVNSVH